MKFYGNLFDNVNVKHKNNNKKVDDNELLNIILNDDLERIDNETNKTNNKLSMSEFEESNDFN